MGESLAGLFVVETFLKEPQMFDAYVAVSPSLWWDGGELARQSGAHLRDHSNAPRTLILTLGDEGPEMQAPMDVLTANLRDHALPGLSWSFTPRPTETHATIYHGAAFDAFRKILAAEGPTAFYKGAGSHFLRLGPHMVLVFVILEQLRLVAP